MLLQPTEQTWEDQWDAGSLLTLSFSELRAEVF